MIECNNLSFAAEGAVILRGISFSAEEGEILGVMGPSGSGKSVILKLLAGLFTDTSGAITYGGHPLKDFQKEKKYEKISYCNTTLPDNFDDGVINFLHLARIPYKKAFKNFSDIDTQIIENWAGQFGLMDRRNSALRTLSDSVLRMTVLAGTFIGEAQTMIIDDPTAFLDIASLALLHRAVKRYVINGERTIILGGNDINFALQVADRILMLKGNGSIAAICTPESVTRELLMDVFGSEILLSRNIYNGRPEVHIFPE